MTKRPVQRAGPPRANRLQPRCTEQPRPQPADRRPSPAKWRPRARRRAAKRRRRGGGAPCTTCGPAKCQQASAEVHRATSAPTCRPAPVASRVEPARWAKGHEAETPGQRQDKVLTWASSPAYPPPPCSPPSTSAGAGASPSPFPHSPPPSASDSSPPARPASGRTSQGPLCPRFQKMQLTEFRICKLVTVWP